MVLSTDFLLNLVDADVGHLAVLVEDLGKLLEGGAAGLDVEEVDEDELAEDPDLVFADLV